MMRRCRQRRQGPRSVELGGVSLILRVPALQALGACERAKERAAKRKPTRSLGKRSLGER